MPSDQEEMPVIHIAGLVINIGGHLRQRCAWCALCRQNREGDVVCDQWDEYDDVCRMVPLFIRVVEDDRG